MKSKSLLRGNEKENRNVIFMFLGKQWERLKNKAFPDIYLQATTKLILYS